MPLTDDSQHTVEPAHIGVRHKVTFEGFGAAITAADLTEVLLRVPAHARVRYELQPLTSFALVGNEQWSIVSEWEEPAPVRKARVGCTDPGCLLPPHPSDEPHEGRSRVNCLCSALPDAQVEVAPLVINVTDHPDVIASRVRRSLGHCGNPECGQGLNHSGPCAP